MAEKKSQNFKKPFDDSDLPFNPLSQERIEEIEKVALPILNKAFEKLRKEKPHLFENPSK